MRLVVGLLIAMLTLVSIAGAQSCPGAYCIFVPFTSSGSETEPQPVAPVEPVPTASPTSPAAPMPTRAPQPTTTPVPASPPAAPTPEPSLTAAPTATATPTATFTSTETATPTATASSSPPLTPSATATATPTRTFTPSATPSRTPAPSTAGLAWSRGDPSPIVRAEAEGAAIGNQLYLFGGYSYPLNGWSPYSRVDVYDVTRNEWTRRRDLPRPINHTGVAVDGRFVYLAGGYVANETSSGAIYGTRDVWRYDSAADTYSAMPPLPAARAAGALVLAGRTLHYFGGTNQQRTADTGDHWALNLDGGTTWQRRASLPNPRNHLGAVALDGLIYAVGGQHDHETELVTQRDVHRYDPDTDTWTAMTPLPAVVVDGTSYGRGHISSATFVRDGKIVVAGGEYRHMRRLRDIIEYDPQTNRWRALTSLPEPRYSGVAHQFGATLIYATGGDDDELTNTTFIGR